MTALSASHQVAFSSRLCRVRNWLESVSILDSSDLTGVIIDSRVFALLPKLSTLPSNARSSDLPSRVRFHLSIGLRCWSGFKHRIAVNTCTLRLLAGGTAGLVMMRWYRLNSARCATRAKQPVYTLCRFREGGEGGRPFVKVIPAEIGQW